MIVKSRVHSGETGTGAGEEDSFTEIASFRLKSANKSPLDAGGGTEINFIIKDFDKRINYNSTKYGQMYKCCPPFCAAQRECPLAEKHDVCYNTAKQK